MAKIYPFKGIIYNKKKIKKMDKVVSHPYDVISPKMQDYYYQQSDFNTIKLILGKEFAGDTQYNNNISVRRHLLKVGCAMKSWCRIQNLPFMYTSSNSTSAAKNSSVWVLSHFWGLRILAGDGYTPTRRPFRRPSLIGSSFCALPMPILIVFLPCFRTKKIKLLSHSVKSWGASH